MNIHSINYSEEVVSSFCTDSKLLSKGVFYHCGINCCLISSEISILNALDVINTFLYKELESVDILFIESDLFETILQRSISSVDNSIVMMAHSLFIAAIDNKVSDIHVVRLEQTAQIGFRINGSKVIHDEIDSELCDEMIFVMYNILASTKETTWNRQVSQNANIIFNHNGMSYRLRYAHNPIFGKGGLSYHVVLRIILPSVKSINPDLSFLRLNSFEEIDVMNMVSQPFGIYVIAGTTGSGKSLTLKTILEWMAHYRFENRGVFLSVEDPVEYEIDGCYQSSVTASNESAMANAIKSALRRDPDVLMIGEVRDEMSAKALSTAVESGHYCFTTVHAGSIVTLLTRLISLGIGTDKLSTPGFIAGLQCQKLIPLLCGNCKVEIKNGFFNKSDNGCEQCREGIIGRQLVCEYLIGTSSILEAIGNNRFDLVVEEWKKRRVYSHEGFGEGFTIREKVFFLVCKGRVCSSYFGNEFGGLLFIESEIKEFLGAV
ncbi:Flp pilus assembly complex ATPase component TadA [Shewanella sp. D64]|uniref:ATPase, T2SS/T4P/T4SS family n=1 Tax=unclassified Shewanella TaxID=196818 RepID=UPI0022BA3BBA|nr:MULTISPECIES: ATPase, T2SS/T4P/T4SS family [unclassified Shewanella]MEC4724937.1 Flp pilus assembly complex ATPase component TadA [Shewanella sp. D64]MEC4736270.1 Flp pilus assembly complex ATPase component TadA [Shewanella sp. E94]WBJ97666.1 Flp pilus assembly complex ATPase component TadA [Shewanella sp. MTB7]